MSLRHGTQHGIFGLVSVLLAVKLLVKKGLFLVDDILTHGAMKAPMELALVELPVSLFGTVGGVIVRSIGLGVPAEAAGLVVVYPLLVALLVFVFEGPSPRTVGSYWLGATVITSTAVLMSLGYLPDSGDIGSGLTYHLINHTLAELLRGLVLELGGLLNAAGHMAGLDVDPLVGLVLAVAVVAVGYGLLWETHVGH
ncbi:hypothetical protein [Natranaeroarchaeum aerophilus]|uniref:Uncharacterized protein n=1 Tax=Natranaeroarchaeum aerophilus TaxID=2917711 RepID=A0AAE3K544_9EURY|nr:hypothetical protein [Natranaeroarchaeum aerophilus]MCL9813793.1 hypothetical protein [Natranaeroarchaeum aerophilus]